MGHPLWLFYVGQVVLTVPFALFMVRDVARRHAVQASLAWGLALYLSWFLSNPVLATRFDETLHVASLTNIVGGEGFFAPNPMLPVSSYYPGLELVAGALHWLTGAPLVAAQVATVVAARCALVLALFWLVERLTRSTRAGMLAVFLYGSSSQFWFFNAQFSYQTLALPLMLLALLLTVRAIDDVRRWPLPPLAGALAALALLTVTHHLTSWLAVGVLWVWGVVHFYARDERATRLVWSVAGAATVLAVAWTVVVGPMLWTYLGPLFEDSVRELDGIVNGQDTGRELFSDTSGTSSTPLWERGVMFGSMLGWCLLLVPSGLHGLFGRTLGRSWARLGPLLLAGTYPALLLARVSPTASDVGERASSFVFMAMALVVAAWLAPRIDRVWRPVVAAAGVVLVLGGLIVGGGPDWSRVPGPYLATAEQRSIDHDTLAVARWFGRYAPEGSRFASDTTMNRFLPDLAPVEATTAVGNSVNVTPLMTSDDVDASTVATIRSAEIDFVVSDTRLAGEPPRSGSILEGSNDYGIASVSREELTKFDDLPGAVLVLDGPVKVYDVRGVRGVERTWADRPSPTLPGPVHVGAMVVALEVALALLLGLRHRFGPGVDRLLLGRRAELGWALVLPGLAVVGAAATLLRFPPWIGTGLLAAGGLVALVRLRLSPKAPPRLRPTLVSSALPVALAALVLAALLFAVAGVWRGLLAPAPDLPAPPALQQQGGSATAGGGAGTGASTPGGTP